MDKKTTGIVSYFTLIGWLIAYIAGDREGAKFHLNQSLVLLLSFILVSLISHLPFIGGIVTWALDIILFVFWVLGLISACEGNEKEVPLLGGIKILK